jgi:succinoglycan biosynthesis transport protein ExoP
MFQQAGASPASTPGAAGSYDVVRADRPALRLRGTTTDWTFVLRRRTLVLGGVAGALLLAFLADLTLTPRYRAASQLLISPTDLRALENANVTPSPAPDATNMQVESQTRVLVSDKVLRRVVDSEQLTGDREFQSTGTSVLQLLRGILPFPGRDQGAALVDPETSALRQLQRKVISRRVERTYIVDLFVDTNDPQKSTRIANAITRAYIDEQAAARNEAASRVTASLLGRLSELKERVRQAEEAVERYKAENNIVRAGGNLVNEQQLAEINNQLMSAKTLTVLTKAKYDQILLLARNKPGAEVTLEAVQSTAIARLREQHAIAARQAATVEARLGPRHPLVVEARAQVRESEALITQEIDRLARTMRTEYERARDNEQSLVRVLDQLEHRSAETNLALVKLRELEREAEASRAIYEAFLARARETREQERLDTVNVRVLAEAQPPQDRSFPPRRALMYLGALLAGLMGGGGLAYVVERMSRRPRSAFAPQA